MFGYGYNGIIGIIVLIADVYALVNILGSSASPGNKILWVLVVFLLPGIGFILWYFMGPRGGARARI